MIVNKKLKLIKIIKKKLKQEIKNNSIKRKKNQPYVSVKVNIDRNKLIKKIKLLKKLN